MEEFQEIILAYLESENDSDQNFGDLIKYSQSKHNFDDRMELYEKLKMISSLIRNHHRSPDFYNRVKQIFIFFKNKIEQTFSNFELYDIFKNDSLVIFILYDIKMITIDKCNISQFYYYYFSPEIQKFIENDTKETIENELSQSQTNVLEEINKKTYVHNLIQNDLIEDFISYVNRFNISLEKTIIQNSTYEKNEFLIDKKPTFIEYAAFYGSIQIFQYLKLSNVRLKSSLWLYVIHSKNAELIHILEENKVKPPENSYEKCLEEAVKCHHNDIAKYIKDNLIDKNDDDYNSFAPYCYQYYNFSLFPREKVDIVYLFKYDYINIVNILLQMKGDINEIIDEISIPPLRFLLKNECFELYNFVSKQSIKKIDKYEFHLFDKLKEFIIPPSVTLIDEHAFEQCSISTITIPSSIIEIGKSAFQKCYSLNEINLLASITIIRKDTFRECFLITEITIPSSVKIIEEWAFQGCSSLKKLSFQKPSSLNSIGRYAFFSCISLSKISIPPSVVSIDVAAFEDCFALSILNFESPSSLKSIGFYSFSNCVSLSDFKIPPSVTFVGEHAFDGCHQSKCNIY